MNADAQQRFTSQETEHRRIPSATEPTAPLIAGTVNQSPRRKNISRAEVAHAAQARRVFHLRTTNRALSFVSEQPRRRDKAPRFKSERAELVSSSRDAAQSFLVTQIVKFALISGIKSGHQFIAQSFFRLRRAFVEIPVDHDFVPVRSQCSEPGYKFGARGEESLMMIIRH